MTKGYLGKPISKGDRVAYPVRKGSYMWLEQGEVVELVPYFQGFSVGESKFLRVQKQTGKIVNVYVLDRVIVLPTCAYGGR